MSAIFYQVKNTISTAISFMAPDQRRRFSGVLPGIDVQIRGLLMNCVSR